MSIEVPGKDSKKWICDSIAANQTQPQIQGKDTVDSPIDVSIGLGHKHPTFTCLMQSSPSISLPATQVLLCVLNPCE